MMKGSITISRPQRSDDARYIQIEFNDESSGVNFLTARIGLEEFAETLTGLARSPCEFELRPSLVGKIHQHKEVIVPYSGGYIPVGETRRTVAKQALAPFEVEGWQGRTDDLFNHHRKIAEGYRVTFVRYVEPEAVKNDQSD